MGTKTSFEYASRKLAALSAQTERPAPGCLIQTGPLPNFKWTHYPAAGVSGGQGNLFGRQRRRADRPEKFTSAERADGRPPVHFAGQLSLKGRRPRGASLPAGAPSSAIAR